MDLESVLNLGPLAKTIIVAHDDARRAFTVRLQDIATGKGCLAFRHAAFLCNACCILREATGDVQYSIMADQFNVLDEWSIHRNQRLVTLHDNIPNVVTAFSAKLLSLLHNSTINEAGANALVQCLTLLTTLQKGVFDTATTEILSYATTLLTMFRNAAQHGVDVTKYIDTSNDAVDVAGFANPWCREVQDTVVETGDLVTIIIDADKVPHLLVIVREFSPGVNQLALPGGFKEALESAKQTCLREGAEETAYASSGMRTTYHHLDTVSSKTWDPRPRMSQHGTKSHGLLRVETVN